MSIGLRTIAAVGGSHLPFQEMIGSGRSLLRRKERSRTTGKMRMRVASGKKERAHGPEGSAFRRK